MPHTSHTHVLPYKFLIISLREERAGCFSSHLVMCVFWLFDVPIRLLFLWVWEFDNDLVNCVVFYLSFESMPLCRPETIIIYVIL